MSSNTSSSSHPPSSIYVPDITYHLIFTFLPLKEISVCMQCAHKWYELITNKKFVAMYRLGKYEVTGVDIIVSILHSPLKFLFTDIEIRKDINIIPYLSFLTVFRLQVAVQETPKQPVNERIVHTLLSKLSPTLTSLHWEYRGSIPANGYVYSICKHIRILTNLTHVNIACRCTPEITFVDFQYLPHLYSLIVHLIDFSHPIFCGTTGYQITRIRDSSKTRKEYHTDRSTD